MTTRETAEALVGDWFGRFQSTDIRRAAVLIDAIEAALTTAYEEGASELIVNAQVEYARGQADERARLTILNQMERKVVEASVVYREAEFADYVEREVGNDPQRTVHELRIAHQRWLLAAEDLRLARIAANPALTTTRADIYFDHD